MSTVRIKGDTSGYIDLSAGSSDGALDISSSVTGAPVRTHSDLELETGGIHVKGPSGIEGLIVDADVTNAGVSGRIVLKNNTSASSVYYSNTLGWTFHTGTILGNTSGTQRMYLSPEGYQRLPYQPAFWARSDTYATTGNYPFTNFSISGAGKFNTGNHLNLTSGVFTAPVAGKYQFNGAFHSNSASTTARRIGRFQLNGTSLGEFAESSAIYVDIGASIIVNMSANDTMQVITHPLNFDAVDFSGYLIG